MRFIHRVSDCEEDMAPVYWPKTAIYGATQIQNVLQCEEQVRKTITTHLEKVTFLGSQA